MQNSKGHRFTICQGPWQRRVTASGNKYPVVPYVFESGWRGVAGWSQIRAGKIKDFFNPCSGAGALGYATRADNPRAYDLWRRVHYRLTYRKDYSDVTVDERWLRFDLFLEDLPKIPGFESWESSDGFSLDKDASGKRHYGLGTTCFRPTLENGLAGLDVARGRAWAKTSKPVRDLLTGSVYLSISEAVRQCKVHPRKIRAGKGWEFVCAGK